MITDLPDNHIRLIFAVILYRNDLIDGDTLRDEAHTAFGPVTGGRIADVLVRERCRSMHPARRRRP